MKTKNGWEVYLKMKEMSNGYHNEKRQITIDNLVAECGITEDLAREYVTAFALLDFIEFTDHSKDVFIMTALGRS